MKAFFVCGICRAAWGKEVETLNLDSNFNDTLCPMCGPDSPFVTYVETCYYNGRNVEQVFVSPVDKSAVVTETYTFN